MTYCLSLLCREGIVFLSDSRTSAGVDNIQIHSKMRIFERPGDRMICILSAGNLSITQSINALLDEELAMTEKGHLLDQPSLFSTARHVGETVRRVAMMDRAALQADGLAFNCNLIVGGQIAGQPPGIFQVYPQGNTIEAAESAPFLQIGETKYGKPILDRGFNYETPLGEAVKFGLISLDSAMRSNVSIGTPFEALCYRADALKVGHHAVLEDDDPYLLKVRKKWQRGLINLIRDIPAPSWSCG